MSDASKPQILSWEEVARAIFHEKRITSGLWHVGVALRLGGITGSWQDKEAGVNDAVPTAMVGVTGVGITAVPVPGHMVFDASTGRLAEEVRARDPPRRRKPAVVSKLRPRKRSLP